MKKYAITSTKFSGEIHYKFDESGVFHSIEIFAALMSDHHKWFCENIPKTEARLLKMREQIAGVTINEIPADLSFDAFWRAYNYKVGKKDAEKAWKQTSEANKTLAIQSIAKYDKWLETKPQDKVYPSTYLNKERYFDDFSR